MVVVNQSGEIWLVNIQAEKQFGYSRDELLGQRITDIIPEGYADRLISDALRSASGLVAAGMGEGVELEAQRKDGSRFPIEMMLSPLQTKDGLLVTAAIRNISARKAESERVKRLMDEFIATVNHELRTPLTSVVGALALIRGCTTEELPAPIQRLVAIAHANGQRLVRLVNDILDIEKIESGKVLFVRKTVDVRSVLEQAIETAFGVAERYGVRIRLETPPGACKLESDPDWLLQIVTNLLSNAIKFSPPGEEVLIALKQRKGLVRILVRDHGSGIPLNFRKEIFEKFARADSSDARQKGGTGLGLSIVKQMVVRLGGEVGFIDAPGGGTIFYVDLPVPKPPAATAADAGSVPGIAASQDRERQ
jgi:PAS domain S-box-containing protein